MIQRAPSCCRSHLRPVAALSWTPINQQISAFLEIRQCSGVKVCCWLTVENPYLFRPCIWLPLDFSPANSNPVPRNSSFLFPLFSHEFPKLLWSAHFNPGKNRSSVAADVFCSATAWNSVLANSSVAIEKRIFQNVPTGSKQKRV